MRNRLLVSAAILAAGVALASAQHVPSNALQDRPQARKHDANRLPAARNRRDAARKASQPQHAAAKHPGEPSHGETSPHSARTTARHNESPLAPPRGTREHGDRGMASDRSIWDRAMARGRAQSEQSTRHQGRSQTTTAAAPGDHHGAAAKDHVAKHHVAKNRAANHVAKDHHVNDDHARHQEAHRPPAHAMGRASEKELKARSAAPSHPHQDSTHAAGGQADVRQVQAALNQQGFNVGAPDGKLGQRTKKALIAFQKQHGFKTTGKVDSATLQAINAGSGAQSQNKDRAQQTPPAQAAPQNIPQTVPAEPATTGQGSATPAAAPLQPAPPATTQENGQHLPDASSRVPAGSPQEDYRDDSVPAGNDQR